MDCLLGDRAYELKIRMTTAASGQGRWGEELEFPIDCQSSGFKPILVVLDSTPNPKLSELSRAFLNQGGEVYVGQDAWDHLDSLAGPTMAHFLERYVREPIDSLVTNAPDVLPDLQASLAGNILRISMDGETMTIRRSGGLIEDDEHDGIPSDYTESDM